MLYLSLLGGLLEDDWTKKRSNRKTETAGGRDAAEKTKLPAEPALRHSDRVREVIEKQFEPYIKGGIRPTMQKGRNIPGGINDHCNGKDLLTSEQNFSSGTNS
jgi:hypothetical protein